MNVLCMGERIIGIELAREILRTFLSARYEAEERFQRRLDKVLAIEKNWLK
jgi:ribose 5-phosphate isomerase B